MTPYDHVAAWRRWLVAAGRPASTVRLRTYQVTRFCESHPQPFACSSEDIARWLGGQEWLPETRRSYRAALVGFYRWAVVTGRGSSNPAADLPPIRVPRRKARPAPEPVIAAALAHADARLSLMIDLAARCGLRRGEIARVNRADLAAAPDGFTLLVHGKGGHERRIPVPVDVAARIDARGHADPGGWVFPGAIEGHLSARWVGDLVGAALPGVWTTHTLRHRFGTRAYAASHDLRAVQELLGHAKPETTMLYTDLPGEAMRAATAWAA